MWNKQFINKLTVQLEESPPLGFCTHAEPDGLSFGTLVVNKSYKLAFTICTRAFNAILNSSVIVGLLHSLDGLNNIMLLMWALCAICKATFLWVFIVHILPLFDKGPQGVCWFSCIDNLLWMVTWKFHLSFLICTAVVDHGLLEICVDTRSNKNVCVTIEFIYCHLIVCKNHCCPKHFCVVPV